MYLIFRKLSSWLIKLTKNMMVVDEEADKEANGVVEDVTKVT